MPKPRAIWFAFPHVTFIPIDSSGRPAAQGEGIELYPDELEALRLVYLEKLTQEEAAKRMGISRGTLWRLLDSGRRKLVQAMVELRPIVLVPVHRAQTCGDTKAGTSQSSSNLSG
ncbi:MAG TPA: DUF134 domain-containing protein [Ignisphaera aggregans]|uniref:DUF134 domain-containing protein n=1 Tax=Ignisphaera aggregans TaxID=334771 RepID=A0A833DSR1_9CREN|nr:DUF134 domain-containing protein [Ignisphaera aggregans]